MPEVSHAPSKLSEAIRAFFAWGGPRRGSGCPPVIAAVQLDQRSPLPGGGRRRRQIDEQGRIANLFQGEAPVHPVALRGSVYPGDRRIHAAEVVTVQVHDLDLTDSAQPPNLLKGRVPAVAIWVPSTMRVGVFEQMAT